MTDFCATNLTELWWNNTKERVLAINGFGGRCSDYERFHRFCVCLERMVESEEGRNAEAWLSERFGGEWVLNSATCHRVWRLVADRLTLPAFLWEPIPTVWERPLQPEASPAVFRVRSVNELPASTNGWREWERVALAWLEGLEAHEQIPLLRLSEGYAWKKPDLYHVERHLSGLERDDRMWENQAAIQLMGQCQRRGLPIAVECSDGEALLALLAGAEGFSPLPRLVWVTDAQTANQWLGQLCQRILKHRSEKEEGIPPILIACGENGRSGALPINLLCAVAP
ncbi:MAG: hypothetical protein E7620_03050 [Ruminococcaceae bacterium]|nr:hypothetical protein [Oscillospiraceae bacterium]